MRRFAIVGVVLVLMGGGVLRAEDPAPQKEHEWLKQLAGVWEYDLAAPAEPGQPPLKTKGTESVRMVGGFWVVAENKATLFEMPFTGILTLGFDGQKKKYVGTWIDSMHSHLVHYEGTVDAAGKALTLLSEGPNPAAPGKLCPFKNVIELKSKDHKVFTSSFQGEDGKWAVMMTINFRRKQ